MNDDAASTSTGLLDTAFDFLNKAGATYNNFTAQKDATAKPAETSIKPAIVTTTGTINTQSLLLIGGAILALVVVVKLAK